MKQLHTFFLFLYLFLFLGEAGGGLLHAQTYYQVTAINSVQSVGGINVTVSYLTNPGSFTNCGIGPYDASGGFGTCIGYKFVFSSPVYAIRAHLMSINTDDTMEVKINSTQYYVTPANLSAFTPSASCTPVTNSNIAHNGFIEGTQCCNITTCPAVQFDIQTGYNIDSIEIFSSGVGGSGVWYDLYFAYGCGATPLISADTPCSGNSLHLGLTVVGTSISYTWSGPNSFSSTAQYPLRSNIQSNDAGSYTVVVNADSCTYYDTIMVNVKPTPSTAITSTNPACTGDSLHLSVSNSVPSTIYQWHGPNNFSDSVYDPVRANLVFSDSGYYAVTASASSCSSSDSIFVSVNPSPAIPIAASNSPVCAGDTIKLTISNPQSGVGYYWSGPVAFSINAQNPTRPNAQSSYAGLYSAVASLNGCTTFATTTVTVNPQLGPPTISISASPDTICAGGNVTLSAVAGNPGSSPAYLWRRNGTVIAGANSPVFTTSNIANGDHIVCKVTSNAACQHTDTALSNMLTMHVILIAPPSVTVTSYPPNYINGDTVTFTGHLPSNTNGYTYQWRKNGMDIPGATFSIYTTSNVHIGDTICLVVHSSIPCTIPDTAIACIGLTEGVGTWQSALSNVKVWPNPITDELNIEIAGRLANNELSIKIYDIVGRQVYSGMINTSSPLERSGEASINTHSFSKGTYLLELLSNDGSREIRKIVK